MLWVLGLFLFKIFCQLLSDYFEEISICLIVLLTVSSSLLNLMFCCLLEPNYTVIVCMSHLPPPFYFSRVGYYFGLLLKNHSGISLRFLLLYCWVWSMSSKYIKMMDLSCLATNFNFSICQIKETLDVVLLCNSRKLILNEFSVLYTNERFFS